MVTVEKIIAELKVGGYLDAAEYIERQFATINRTAEFGYMKAFIIEGDFTEDVYRAQLRALWTAYCLHHNLDVDTLEYDDDLLGLWSEMHKLGSANGWSEYQEFTDFMCEQFLHDYEFEDARRIYTNGSRLIPSFRVKQMMEHYAPSVEQTGWYGIVRWCAEDVIAAAELNGVTLTEAQAEKWLEKNERWFKEMLTEYGNEVLASASKESFEEVREG